MKAQLFQWFNKQGISFFISAVLIIILIGATLTFYSRQVISRQKEKSMLAQQVILDLKDMTTMILLADVGVRGYMIVKEDRFISPFNQAREAYVPFIKNVEKILAQQDYQELDSMIVVKADINAYMQVMDNMYQLTKQAQLEEAQSILYKDLGFGLMQNYNRFVAKVRIYEQEVLAEADYQLNLCVTLITYTQWLLILLGLPTLVLVMVRIRKSEKSRKELFKVLDESNKKYIFDSSTEEKGLNEENIIESIVQNLRQALGFIKRITAGDYQVAWEGIQDTDQTANQENLAGELIQMREQMKRVKEADQRRLWATEGLSIVAEITRKYQQHTDQLGEQLVMHVVQYLKANQAGLFVLTDGDDLQNTLELTACYAYERKKYLKKNIAIGEGLVGQAYLEAETIYLTEIPEAYVNITSGLGQAKPCSILIVPLKYNEEVMGILEIASFRQFEDYQIKFVESLGEIIASALSTAKTNAQTQILLQQSQEQAEEMRAQEEEMRQNMEELQATQEEMQRKTKEYEELIQEYEQKNHEVDKA